MIHSFGSASGGTWADPSALSIFTSFDCCSVVEQRQARWQPDQTTLRDNSPVSSRMPNSRHFRLEFVTSREVCGCFLCKPLLAQTEAFHNLAIPIRVPAVEIVQQSAALVYHPDHTPT